ncbi:hypothetical protein GT375_14245 [Listeria monocytogenes]|nr:hypothetical protein [Listeria monocytogenes]
MNNTNYMLFEEDRLIQFVETVGHHFTEDLGEAMFLWPDGSMTSSSELGVRGDDHNILSSYFDYLGKNEIFEMSRNEMFEVAASTAGMVLLSPESQTVSMAENQKLTRNQQEILANSSYQIDYFSEGITQNQGLKKLGMNELVMNDSNFFLLGDEELDQFVFETGQHYTDDPNEAMFLWPHGKMTSSNEGGVRGDDHNILSSYFEFIDREEIFDMNVKEVFEIAAATCGTIIMSPELQTATLAKNQTITDKQQEIIEDAHFYVNYMTDGISTEEAFEKLDIDVDYIEELKNKSANPSHSY